jgi:pimeloyl-ACP methyl ester carboxylesterase|tara:strand:+ start:6368 stop:7258 length:891 start_codon:yes stop_codon:yes gene_type:complete
MKITDNLENDIINAPQWFHDGIKDVPEDKIVENNLGDISYSKWASNNESQNLILFIHGTGAHKKWWDPIAPQFKDHANVIAIDLPGMGESGFREKYSIKDFGDCVISVIEKEKLETDINNVYIVGHSLGGQVAGYVASERQELITSLIIIDTFIRPPDYDPADHKGGPLRMIKHYPDKLTILERFRLMPNQECENDWFLRYIAEHSVKEVSEGWRWRFDDVMFTSLERLFGYKFSFTCPTLFVHGEKSLLTSGNILDHIKLTYSDIMDFVEVADAAHHVPLDKPLEIVTIIKERLF